MYKVIYKFADLKDHRHVYNVGDTYPREGSKPTQERIEALANGMNKIGRPLIEEIIQPVKEEKIMNEPVEVEEPVEEEPIEEEKPKPKRGRRKKADSEKE